MDGHQPAPGAVTPGARCISTISTGEADQERHGIDSIPAASPREYHLALASEYGPSTSAARAVAMMLSVHLDFETIETFTSAATLARMTGLSDKTVREALKILRAEGWFTERTEMQWRPGTRCRVYPRRLMIPAAIPASVYRKKSKQPVTTTGRARADLPVNTTGTLPVDSAGPTGKNQPNRPVATTANLVLDRVKEDLGAGSGAMRKLSRAEILAREEEVNREKAAQRRESERALAVRRMLREGAQPERIASELNEALSYVLAQRTISNLLRGIGKGITRPTSAAG